MQLFHAQPARPIPRFTSLEATARRLVTWIAANRRCHVLPAKESPCPGHAWTDSAERELTDNIASCRFTRY